MRDLLDWLKIMLDAASILLCAILIVLFAYAAGSVIVGLFVP